MENIQKFLTVYGFLLIYNNGQNNIYGKHGWSRQSFKFPITL